MQEMFSKLSSYAALLGVIGAIGGGFMAWGEFNNRIAQLEDKEFVVNETVDLSGIIKELEAIKGDVKIRLDVDDNTAVSMPVRNLLTIIGACLVGAWFGFGVLERLNSIESDLRLMQKDLEAANAFIDGVPKGDMVSPQVQELYMLVEYLSGNVDKLKAQMEEEIPMILKNDMVIQFHEERLIDLESKQNGVH
jgi:tetrahydromethanopterin S-methyltransferase subunit B